MMVHSVYFWLKPELDDDARAAFLGGLLSLRAIPGVRTLYAGPPSATPPRPVVVGDYTFGLTVVLDGMAAHDAYQASPEHQAFLKRFSPCWDRVQVLDFDPVAD